MGNSSYFRFDDDNKTSIHILSIITKEMGKLKTYSPTYCIMDNWENMLNLTHTPEKLYLTGILSSMSSDKVCTMMIMRWCNVQTNEYDLQAKTYPTICIHQKLHNTNERNERNEIMYVLSGRTLYVLTRILLWCSNKHQNIILTTTSWS